MYSKPTEDSDVVSQAILGSNVVVVERTADWARIRTADDYSGWTPLAHLRLNQRYAASGRVAEVASLFAHIYRDNSVMHFRPLLTAPFEAKLEVIAEPPESDRRWLQVRLPDDRAGWVQRGDLAFDAKPVGITEMIELAKRFLGAPYTWGGTSSFGYDCSGFAQMLCRRRGIFMPRDAHQQAAWNGIAAVKREELAPGDLLYFGPSAEKITHTGVYIGEGKFINATTHQTPNVRIDVLDDPHWSKILVACRRPRI
jgi:cell wall-associated NlpC family hydrolase